LYELDLGPPWARRASSDAAAGGASGVRGEGGCTLCLVRAARHGGTTRRPDLEEVVVLPILGCASASMVLGGAVGRAGVLRVVQCYCFRVVRLAIFCSGGPSVVGGACGWLSGRRRFAVQLGRRGNGPEMVDVARSTVACGATVGFVWQ
jgi:hypothetical protein